MYEKIFYDIVFQSLKICTRKRVKEIMEFVLKSINEVQIVLSFKHSNIDLAQLDNEMTFTLFAFFLLWVITQRLFYFNINY